MALKQERKSLEILNNVNTSEGPFTNPEEESSYMADDKLGLNTKDTVCQRQYNSVSKG